MAFVTRHHAGQHGSHGLGEPIDVGGDHLLPIADLGFVGRLKAQRQTRIGHAHVWIAEVWG